MTCSVRPYRLPSNVIEHFYRGGARIAELRGHDRRIGPEEWLASTVARWGSDKTGLTDLGPAGLLVDLVDADPDGWLGAAHVARWGSSPAVLVKLLDAGQRLPVHAHPDRSFASRHLGCAFGKTEAWVALDVPDGGGTVYVGTNRPLGRVEWAELVEAQATDAMLALLHPVEVHPGDGVVVPASTPHCIDAGVFVVELQEPTDFSVLLEWDGFAIDGRADGHLGLGFEIALDAVRRNAVGDAELDRLIRRAATADSATGPAPRSLLPAAAAPYFRAWSVADTLDTVTVPAAFSVVVVTGGAGTLRWCDGGEPLSRGDALVVPHAAGPLSFSPGVTAVVAQPPAADAPEPDEAGAR
jgi:mannose-6-phosphate isomerase